MTTQEQIRKLLINEFDFKLVTSKRTTFGERWQLRSEAGLEAQLGVYRVCFYSFQPSDEDASRFPAARQPLCFDTDQRGEMIIFLEKSLGIRVKPKKRAAKIAAPTLFEL